MGPSKEPGVADEACLGKFRVCELVYTFCTCACVKYIPVSGVKKKNSIIVCVDSLVWVSALWLEQLAFK